MRMIKGSIIASAAAFLLSTGAVAQEVEPADAINYRQSAFSVMAWHFGPMGKMAKGEIDYNPKEFASRAQTVNALAGLPWEGFIDGSYAGDAHGVDTDAMAKIADNQDDFRERKFNFMGDTATLAEVAQEGDFDASRRAFATVANSCKGCHDNYRDK
ncbi:c-type cytochrome [Halomonas sp. LS-001]